MSFQPQGKTLHTHPLMLIDSLQPQMEHSHGFLGASSYKGQAILDQNPNLGWFWVLFSKPKVWGPHSYHFSTCFPSEMDMFSWGVTKVSVGWSLHWDRDPRSRRSPNSSKGCSRVAGEMSSLEGFFIFLYDVSIDFVFLTILNQTLGDWNSKSSVNR